MFNVLSMETYQLSPGGFLSNQNKKKTGPYRFTITMAKFCIGQEAGEGKETERGAERGEDLPRARPQVLTEYSYPFEEVLLLPFANEGAETPTG